MPLTYLTAVVVIIIYSSDAMRRMVPRCLFLGCQCSFSRLESVKMIVKKRDFAQKHHTRRSRVFFFFQNAKGAVRRAAQVEISSCISTSNAGPTDARATDLRPIRPGGWRHGRVVLSKQENDIGGCCCCCCCCCCCLICSRSA